MIMQIQEIDGCTTFSAGLTSILYICIHTKYQEQGCSAWLFWSELFRFEPFWSGPFQTEDILVTTFPYINN